MKKAGPNRSLKYFFEDLSFSGLMNNISRSLGSELVSKIILNMMEKKGLRSINGKKKQIPSTIKNPSSTTIWKGNFVLIINSSCFSRMY